MHLEVQADQVLGKSTHKSNRYLSYYKKLCFVSSVNLVIYSAERSIARNRQIKAC